MSNQTETRKVRDNLTAEEKARLQEYGSLAEGQNVKTAYSTRTEIFIPSRKQH